MIKKRLNPTKYYRDESNPSRAATWVTRSMELVEDENGIIYKRNTSKRYGDKFFFPVTNFDKEYHHFPLPVKIDSSAPCMCMCGNKRLFCFSSGDYETSVRCPKCKKTCVVHSG